jgi:hypothetical protein
MSVVRFDDSTLCVLVFLHSVFLAVVFVEEVVYMYVTLDRPNIEPWFNISATVHHPAESLLTSQTNANVLKNLVWKRANIFTKPHAMPQRSKKNHSRQSGS